MKEYAGIRNAIYKALGLEPAPEPPPKTPEAHCRNDRQRLIPERTQATRRLPHARGPVRHRGARQAAGAAIPLVRRSERFSASARRGNSARPSGTGRPSLKERQGEYGLYHAQISPAPKYAPTMTPEQWKRAADILGEELGLQDQPRALVLHAGKDDRPHLHVVWSRTDIDEMKLRSDSFNYQAHERASHRMELEFGQEFVPGKHAKRDREKAAGIPPRRR